jgi:hypothetical protein
MNSLLWYFINFPLKMTPYESEHLGQCRRNEKKKSVIRWIVALVGVDVIYFT